MMSLEVSDTLADTIIPLNEQESTLDKTPDPSKYNCTIDSSLHGKLTEITDNLSSSLLKAEAVKLIRTIKQLIHVYKLRK